MLELETFQQAHFKTLAAWFKSEAEVVQWGGPLVHYPLTDDQFEHMLAETAGTPPARLAWMVCDAGRPIGHAQLVLDWKTGAARLARVIVAPAERGRGYSLPMLQRILERAFALSAIESVNLRVYTFNVPAIRTYERLGFAFVGPPSTSTQVGGLRWDARAMSLNRRDWQGPDV